MVPYVIYEWPLSPSDPIPLDQEDLEFRLRFKPPHPGRLKEIDKSAFRYYYAQVRSDLYRGILLKNIAKGQLISNGLFGVFKSTKNPTRFLLGFCPSLKKEVNSYKHKGSFTNNVSKTR